MASSLRSFAAALLFVMLLFMATELGTNTIMVAEARMCESPSGKYKGVCRNGNCASVCMSEGFSDGECKEMRTRCICIKPC